MLVPLRMIPYNTPFAALFYLVHFFFRPDAGDTDTTEEEGADEQPERNDEADTGNEVNDVENPLRNEAVRLNSEESFQHPSMISESQCGVYTTVLSCVIFASIFNASRWCEISTETKSVSLIRRLFSVLRK